MSFFPFFKQFLMLLVTDATNHQHSISLCNFSRFATFCALQQNLAAAIPEFNQKGFSVVSTRAVKSYTQGLKDRTYLV